MEQSSGPFANRKEQCSFGGGGPQCGSWGSYSFPLRILVALPSCGLAEPLTRTPVYPHTPSPHPVSSPTGISYHSHVCGPPRCSFDHTPVPKRSLCGARLASQRPEPFSGIEDTPCYGAKSPPPLWASPHAHLYFTVLQAAHVAPYGGPEIN